MRRVDIVLITLLTTGFCSNSIAQTAFTYVQICKAGIGIAVGRDPAIMSAGMDGGGYLLISYARTEDAQLFTYKCRIIDDRIYWGTAGGRWRDDPQDSILTFYRDGKHLIVQDQFPDGSSIKHKFAVSQLGPG